VICVERECNGVQGAEGGGCLRGNLEVGMVLGAVSQAARLFPDKEQQQMEVLLACR
jgi:hypothetical protein